MHEKQTLSICKFKKKHEAATHLQVVKILHFRDFETPVIDYYCALQVIEMPEHHPGHLGGSMRLGKRRTIFKTDQSLLS